MCPALKWHVQSDISCYAVSPFVFCLIKRLVRAGQQIFQAGRIFRLCGGGADAYGDAALWQVAAGISAAFHRRAQRFPGLQYLRAAAGELTTLNAMTSDQLKQYADLWKQRNKLAKEA